MTKNIAVIDLFAGPGGLGEGFSAFRSGDGVTPFRIGMSVEFEPKAHKTLVLRSFFRQFRGQAPVEYYDYIHGQISRDDLFGLYPDQAEKAREETLLKPRELGPWAEDEKYIFSRLRRLKRDHKGPKVVIGGPPCQAYSTVGRARNKGVTCYSESKDKRYFLYEEYSKVLAIVEPEVFVLENVVGMLSAKLDGKPILPDVLNSLRRPRLPGRDTPKKGLEYRIYSVSTGAQITDSNAGAGDAVVNAYHYGVPQKRKRVILLGVREGGAKTAVPPALIPAVNDVVACCTVKNTIGGLPPLRSDLSQNAAESADWLAQSKGDRSVAWQKAVSHEAKHVARELKQKGLNSEMADKAAGKAGNLKNCGGNFVKSNAGYKGPEHLRDWLFDKNLRGFANHETRGHKPSDLKRYLYYSCFAAQNSGVSPHVYDLPDDLKPDHKNVRNNGGARQDRKFSDRFKVQAANRPASTITSHIKKDGHYYIHYDPSQVRSLTVREAARLQTFPDNYFFEGNQGAQYQQVGNAVPPWLALQIAETVYKLLDK